MAHRGHLVTIFAARQKTTTSWEQCIVRPYEERGEGVWDAALTWNATEALRVYPESTVRISDIQVSNLDFITKKKPADFIDQFVAPSASSAKRLSGMKKHDLPFMVLPNGVDMSAYPLTEKVPGRCIYASSPDRGLHVVLQQWRRIRAAVPHATLRIFYHSLQQWYDEIERYEKNPQFDWQLAQINRGRICRELMPQLKNHGVEHVGSVSRRQMAKEYLDAECLAYSSQPFFYVETFGVAVLEGCASGAVPVLGPCDAFPELWSACPMTKGPVERHADEWAEMVISGLKGGFADIRPKLRALAEQHDWWVLGKKLEDLILSVKARKSRGKIMAVERSAFGHTFKIVAPDEVEPRCALYSPDEFIQHEPVFETWCRVIRKGDVVVDVGACYGSYTLPALAAGAKVIAYEPWVEGRRVLELNVSQNEFAKNLTIRPVALWDKTPPAEALFKRVFEYHYPNGKEVNTSTMDEDLASIGVTRVDWMKFDIEGAELPALLGAQKTLESRPSLIIEDHDDVNPDPACVVSRYAASIDSSKRIKEMLTNLGYVVETVPWGCGRKYIVAHHPSRSLAERSVSIDGPIGSFMIPKEPAETQRVCAGLSRGVWGFPGGYDMPDKKIPEYDHEALTIPDVQRVIDIGAGWGAFAVWALGRWGKNIELECYEPNPLAVPYLSENTRGYNVHVHQRAVSTNPSVVLRRGIDWGELQTHPDGEGDHVAVIHPRDLPPCDVLKCDGEGIELDVLRNYQHFKTLKAVIYEWHNANHRALLREICQNAGLRCVRDDNGPWGDGNGAAVWVR
jgi:FkbM family methyltransferase